MKMKKWVCIKCLQFFSRFWNAKRHCNIKHGGNHCNIMSSAFILNLKPSTSFDTFNTNSYFTDNQTKNEIDPIVTLSQNRYTEKPRSSFPNPDDIVLEVFGFKSLPSEKSNPTTHHIQKQFITSTIFLPNVIQNAMENNQDIRRKNPTHLDNIEPSNKPLNYINNDRQYVNIKSVFELLYPQYEKIRELLSGLSLWGLPENEISKFRGSILISAIAYDDPVKSMDKSIKSINAVKFNHDMLTDISNFLGCDKLSTIGTLKFVIDNKNIY